MRKVLLLMVVLGVIIGGFMAVKPKTYSPTKIPYNNGFYAGPYNPKLPVIDPAKK